MVYVHSPLMIGQLVQAFCLQVGSTIYQDKQVTMFASQDSNGRIRAAVHGIEVDVAGG